jgi:phosphomannomutase
LFIHNKSFQEIQMPEKVSISDLMERSGVKFGTSGARGLVRDMTDSICYAYTAGFIQYLETTGDLKETGGQIAIAGDLRASTDRIMAAVAKAIHDRGYRPVNCGKIPSSAVALYGLDNKIPAIMVTGSHIPDDRNGIKYNKSTGEILKDDEAGMKSQIIDLPDIFDDAGMLEDPFIMEAVNHQAEALYIERWTRAFPSDFLKGKKIGLYEHSAVGRKIYCIAFLQNWVQVLQSLDFQTGSCLWIRKPFGQKMWNLLPTGQKSTILTPLYPLMETVTDP